MNCENSHTKQWLLNYLANLDKNQLEEWYTLLMQAQPGTMAQSLRREHEMIKARNNAQPIYLAHVLIQLWEFTGSTKSSGSVSDRIRLKRLASQTFDGEDMSVETRHHKRFKNADGQPIAITITRVVPINQAVILLSNHEIDFLRQERIYDENKSRKYRQLRQSKVQWCNDNFGQSSNP